MSGKKWRWPLLAREALKNTLLPRARIFPYTVLAIFSASAVCMFLVGQFQVLETDISDARSEGRNVFVIQSIDSEYPTQFERSSCERASRFRTVVRSGFLVSLGREDILAIGDDLPLYAASNSLLDFRSGAGLIIGEALPVGASEFAIVRGERSTATRGVFEPPGIDTNSAIVAPLIPTVDFHSACIVELVPFAGAEDLAVVRAQLELQGDSAFPTTAYDDADSIVDRFLDRPERFISVLIGFVGGIVTALAMRSRRGGYAAYAFGGSSSASVALIIALECVIVSGLAAASGGLIAFGGSVIIGTPPVLHWSSLTLALTWLAASVPLAVPAAWSSPVKSGKRRG